MPRELSEKDISILKKMAPECGDLTCSGSGHMFHSILPPVSNHFAADNANFVERIRMLSEDELIYLAGLIERGEESTGCMPVEDIESFVRMVAERISPDTAKRVITTFESGGECER